MSKLYTFDFLNVRFGDSFDCTIERRVSIQNNDFSVCVFWRGGVGEIVPQNSRMVTAWT
jgi:hypothetical protein